MKAQIGPENMLIYSENLYEDGVDFSTFRSIGDFENKILFLANDHDFTEENEALFGKICDAASLKTSDYKLLVLPPKCNPLAVINTLKPSELICFDIENLTLNKILNKTIQINDYQLLTTNSISEISSNPEVKKAFWNALKKLLT